MLTLTNTFGPFSTPAGTSHDVGRCVRRTPRTQHNLAESGFHMPRADEPGKRHAGLTASSHLHGKRHGLTCLELSEGTGIPRATSLTSLPATRRSRCPTNTGASSVSSLAHKMAPFGSRAIRTNGPAAGVSSDQGCSRVALATSPTCKSMRSRRCSGSSTGRRSIYQERMTAKLVPTWAVPSAWRPSIFVTFGLDSLEIATRHHCLEGLTKSKYSGHSAWFDMCVACQVHTFNNSCATRPMIR